PTIIAVCLSAALFCLEATEGPIWSVPMDIAPKHAGTASGIMNTGSAAAAIVSPVVGGWLIDRTGNWNLPFTVSMAIMAAGIVLSFTMRPDRALDSASRSADGAHAHTAA
ncbi:MAG: MFS transporter, partial [Paraburkholderia tropica]